MSSFQLEPVLTADQFIEKFQKWLDHGKENNLLAEYKPNYRLRKVDIDPLDTAFYLYSLFLNELRRDGQKVELLLEEIHQKYGREYLDGINLFAKTPNGIEITEREDTEHFPKVVNGLEQSLIKKWRGDKEKIHRDILYHQIWNLFVIPFFKKGIVTSVKNSELQYRKIYAKNWGEKSSKEDQVEL